MSINIFNHAYTPEVNAKLGPIARTLCNKDSITAFHTPVVLPLINSEEIGGGYACSLGLPFGPKWIALNCDRFSQESPSMQEFILARQVALFHKPTRYLHIPLAAIAVTIGYIASSILFPSSSIALVIIPTIIAAISANLIAKKEQENEKYADLIAFHYCNDAYKQNILDLFKTKIIEEDANPRSFINNLFSSFPSHAERYDQLVKDPHTNDFLKQQYIPTDVIREARA